MACSTTNFCTSHKIFIFINVAFAMYSGALLATAARLAWDPSTYTWFRYLCEVQYRVSAVYVLAAGVWLAALVSLAAAAPARLAALRAYCAGVLCLAASELAYAAWMGVSLAAWWQDSPRAELARRGMDLMHDIKPALLAVERYRDVARPLYDMIEEMEREAPNNAVVIIIFGVFGMFLQIAAVVMARRLSHRSAVSLAGTGAGMEKAPPLAPAPLSPTSCDVDEDSECGDTDSHHTHPRGWRKNANLRMYTILDKIF